MFKVYHIYIFLKLETYFQVQDFLPLPEDSSVRGVDVSTVSSKSFVPLTVGPTRLNYRLNKSQSFQKPHCMRRSYLVLWSSPGTRHWSRSLVLWWSSGPTSKNKWEKLWRRNLWQNSFEGGAQHHRQPWGGFRGWAGQDLQDDGEHQSLGYSISLTMSTTMMMTTTMMTMTMTKTSHKSLVCSKSLCASWLWRWGERTRRGFSRGGETWWSKARW